MTVSLKKEFLESLDRTISSVAHPARVEISQGPNGRYRVEFQSLPNASDGDWDSASLNVPEDALECFSSPDNVVDPLDSENRKATGQALVREARRVLGL